MDNIRFSPWRLRLGQQNGGDDVHRLIQQGLGVAGHVTGAQQALPLRRGRRQYRVHINTSLIQRLGFDQGSNGVIRINGHNGRSRGANRQSPGLQAVSGVGRQTGQPVHQLRALAQLAQRLQGDGAGHRRKR